MNVSINNIVIPYFNKTKETKTTFFPMYLSNYPLINTFFKSTDFTQTLM